ncbi:MAG: LuxR C-terminal-related transcriptional regulator [Alphaproteobacteria bacterium]|nr:LuxR C-terminal-related transcriptional regulator [Alphaproteobacteria bacterium]
MRIDTVRDRITQFSDALARATAPSDAIALLQAELHHMGIEGIDFFGTPRAVPGADVVREPDYVVSTLPESLVDDYYAFGWDDICPVVDLAYGASDATLTSSVFANAQAGSKRREMWDAMRDHNIEHEINIPLSDDRHVRQISIYTVGRSAADAARFAEARHAGQDVATQFIYAYEALVQHDGSMDSVALTPRETECLQWVSTGLTNLEIAERLNVSARTVKFHLANAMAKMDVTTRSQAIAEASRHRQVRIGSGQTSANSARQVRQFLAKRLILAHEAPGDPGENDGLPVLTPREAECLQWVGSGLTNPEIADRLDVSARTVKFHLANVMAKLGVTTRSQAVATALRHRLVRL